VGGTLSGGGKGQTQRVWVERRGSHGGVVVCRRFVKPQRQGPGGGGDKDAILSTNKNEPGNSGPTPMTECL